MSWEEFIFVITSEQRQLFFFYIFFLHFFLIFKIFFISFTELIFISLKKFVFFILKIYFFHTSGSVALVLSLVRSLVSYSHFHSFLARVNFHFIFTFKNLFYFFINKIFIHTFKQLSFGTTHMIFLTS